MAEKLRKSDFNLEDFLAQLQQVKKLGSMESILGMMPGMSGVKIGDGAEKQMARTEAIIKSMTLQERRNPGSSTAPVACGLPTARREGRRRQSAAETIPANAEDDADDEGGGGKKLMRQMEAMRDKGQERVSGDVDAGSISRRRTIRLTSLVGRPAGQQSWARRAGRTARRSVPTVRSIAISCHLAARFWPL